MNVIGTGYHGQELQSKSGGLTKLSFGAGLGKSQPYGEYVTEQGQKEEEIGGHPYIYRAASS